MPFDTLKHRFFHFIQIAFLTSPQVQNKLRVPCETLKRCFYDLIQVSFWDGQEAEYEFKVKCEPLKHRFVQFTHYALGLVKRKKTSSDCLATS